MFEKIISVLGKDVRDTTFKQLKIALDEEPIVTQPIKSSRHYQFYRSGISVGYNPQRNTIFAIWLYGKEQEGFATYAGQILDGKSMDAQRLEVRRIMGRPVRTGVAWDLYSYPDYEIHFEYDVRSQKIRLLTLQLCGDWQL